jgi:hypothetical protein
VKPDQPAGQDLAEFGEALCGGHLVSAFGERNARVVVVVHAALPEAGRD